MLNKVMVGGPAGNALHIGTIDDDLIIDVQERLARAMPQEQLRLLVANVRRLGAAARREKVRVRAMDIAELAARVMER